MNKKTLTVVVVAVVALVVLSGVFYGYNRWRQQRLANQILGMYGVNTGLINNLGGNTAVEVGQSPEQIFNSTSEMSAYDENSKAVVADARDIVEKVFGKTKLTAYTSGSYGVANQNSGLAMFKTSRLTLAADVSALNKVLTDKGLRVISSGADRESGSIMAGNDTDQYIIGFGIGEQDITVTIVKTSK